MSPPGLAERRRRAALHRATTLLPIPGSLAGVGPDGPLLLACTRGVEIERQKQALFDGPTRVADEDERDRLLDKLERAQLPHLRRAGALRARGAAAPRLRAALYAATDHELWYLVAAGDVRAKLLARVLGDLIGRAPGGDV